MEMYGSRRTTNSRWIVRYVGKASSHPTMTLSNDPKAFEREDVKKTSDDGKQQVQHDGPWLNVEY